MKSFSKRVLILVFIFGLMPIFLFPGNGLSAADGSGRSEAPPVWDDGISYLLAMLRNREASFDVQKLSGLLDFVASEKSGDTNLDPGKRENATGAYFFVDVKAPLSKVIKYAYNPRIPAYLTLPSVVRLCGWQVKPTGPVSSLWKKVGNVNDPLMLRGVEYEEITPDLTTGAYYRYSMDRMMILLKYQGRDYFISVTRQKNPSNVGKKGAIIGPDTDWNYFYSGQQGLNTTGLGWVSSYMYDAFSVSLLFEQGTSKTRTRLVTFKWLRAGWNGLNMVKRENILEGCKRFALGFRKVLESPRLPQAERLIEVYAKIKGLPDQDLTARLQPIDAALQKLCRTDPNLSRKDFKDIIESGKYLAGMSREEREGLLMTEYMKLAIGKPSYLNKTSFDYSPALSLHMDHTDK